VTGAKGQHWRVCTGTKQFGSISDGGEPGDGSSGLCVSLCRGNRPAHRSPFEGRRTKGRAGDSLTLKRSSLSGGMPFKLNSRTDENASSQQLREVGNATGLQ
jgi:hypothetical protein